MGTSSITTWRALQGGDSKMRGEECQLVRKLIHSISSTVTRLAIAPAGLFKNGVQP